LFVPEPPEWQRIGNQIDAAMIFARSGLRKRALVASLSLERPAHEAHDLVLPEALREGKLRGKYGRNP
jgi:hypothetical protein